MDKVEEVIGESLITPEGISLLQQKLYRKAKAGQKGRGRGIRQFPREDIYGRKLDVQRLQIVPQKGPPYNSQR